MMTDKSVVIAALARDCNQALRHNIPHIEALRKHFARSHVVVVENDSKDGTKQTLLQWAKDAQGIDIIMNDFGAQTIPPASPQTPYPSASLHRIEKMARYRNMYMDHVRSLDWQPDYLIVIDVDVASFSVEGIMEAIEHAPEDWGGLFANGRIHYRGKFPCYYDLFAYIPERDGATFERKSNELYHETRLINRLIGHDPYLRCLSAFCGMGVYKWQAVKDLSYRTLPNTRSRKHEAVCEHIPFNMEVCAKGNGNYVCRSMWLNYGNIRTLKHLFIYSILPTRLFLLFYKLVKRKPFDD